MEIETALLFSALCGILAVCFKRNIMNSFVAIHQIIFAFIGLTLLLVSPNNHYLYTWIIVLGCVLATTIFGYTIAVMLIKRRSTLHVNEVAELRD